MFSILVQIRRIYCMLHIASYHHYTLAKIHLSQGYFNISCHWHTNMKWVFYVWAWTYFFSFIMICTYLRCYTPSDVHLIMHALCEKKQLKELMDQKSEDVLFSSMFFPMFLKFWLQSYFDMWFDNLIKYITSLLYNEYSMILTHLYLYKNVFSDMNIHLSKEKKIT
jgi:hypothetical protein